MAISMQFFFCQGIMKKAQGWDCRLNLSPCPAIRQLDFSRKTFSYLCTSISLLMMIFKGLPVSDIPWRLSCLFLPFLLFRAILWNIDILMAKIIKSEEAIFVAWHMNFGFNVFNMTMSSICCMLTVAAGSWESGQVFSEPQFTSCKMIRWRELCLRFFLDVRFWDLWRV